MNALRCKMLTASMCLVCVIAARLALAGDRHELEGVWAATSIEKQGKPASAEEIKATSFAFLNNELLVRAFGVKEEIHGSYKVDDKTAPKQLDMDLVKLSGVFHGIYDVEGDELRICFENGGEAGDRPTEFSTQEDKKTILTLMKFKRKKRGRLPRVHKPAVPKRSFRVPGAVHSLAFSADGKLLAVGCSAPSVIKENLDDGLVELWNWKSGERVAEIRQDGRRKRDGGASDVQNFIRSMAFSPDGTMLATGDTRGARLWNVESKKEMARFDAKGTGASAVAFSRDGSRLFCAMGSDVKVVDVKRLTEQEQLEGNSGQLYDIALAPDGLTLAAASLGNRIVLWNTKTGVRREVKSYGALYGVTFSPKGNQFVSTGSGGAKLWKLTSDRPKTLELDQSTFSYSAAFAPNGEVLALVPINLTSEESKRALTLWNPTTGARLATTPGPYRVAVFSPEGEVVAAAGQHDEGGVVHLFEVEDLLKRNQE